MFGFKNSNGAVVIDGKHVADTIQCVHCGKHWIPKPGSGKVRGWCVSCNGASCGDTRCMDCVPFEAKLEIAEGTRTLGDRWYQEFLDSERKNGKIWL